jgi:hypothetical protein
MKKAPLVRASTFALSHNALASGTETRLGISSISRREKILSASFLYMESGEISVNCRWGITYDVTG